MGNVGTNIVAYIPPDGSTVQWPFTVLSEEILLFYTEGIIDGGRVLSTVGGYYRHSKQFTLFNQEIVFKTVPNNH